MAPTPTKPAAKLVKDTGLKTGTFVFPDGSRYDGSYTETKAGPVRQGEGTYRAAYGLSDAGLLAAMESGATPPEPGYHTVTCNWLNDQVQSPVEIEFASGATYQGDVSNGRLHGEGVYTWPTGERYTGSFVDGAMHGAGVLVTRDGRSWQGTFCANSGPGLTLIASNC